MADTDGDGMPDAWETENGLNPNDKTDGAKIGKDGYTNLEIYMNSLVADIMENGNAEGKLLSGNLESSDPAVELPEYVAPEVEEWEISNSTYKGAVGATGTWEFDKGITMASSNANRGYAKGSSKTNDYIKIARNETWTVQLPDGKVAQGVNITGWANTDTNTSWLAAVNDVNYEQNAYQFVSRVESDPSSHDINFSTPVNKFTMKFSTSESVLKFRIMVSDGSSAGIEDVTISAEQDGDNRIFNLMGVEVAEPLAPGIYIQNGKKFLVK